MGELVVFHIPETRSERVVWLLEEMGAPFTVRRLSYRAREVKAPGFLRINPFGMVPTITDDGVGVWETGAVFEYLLRTRRNELAIAPNTAGYTDYLTWLHAVEPTLFPPIADHIMHEEVLPQDSRIPELARRGRETWSEHLRVIEETLATRAYIAGAHFSAADILLGHTLRMANSAGLLPAFAERAGAYFSSLQGRAAFQRMLAYAA